MCALGDYLLLGTGGHVVALASLYTSSWWLGIHLACKTLVVIWSCTLTLTSMSERSLVEGPQCSQP